MGYTFEQLVQLEEKRFNDMEKKQVGNEIHLCSDNGLVYVYEDLSPSFTSLMERFPSIEFVYSLITYYDAKKSEETINVVTEIDEETIRTLYASVWQTDSYALPTLGVFDMDITREENKLIDFHTRSVYLFEDWVSSFIEAIEETPRYKLCRKDAQVKDPSATFADWKKINKRFKRGCELQQENDIGLTLVSKRSKSVNIHVTYCEELTQRLHQYGMKNAFLGRHQITESGNIMHDDFRFFFYHQGHLMVIWVPIVDGGDYNGLRSYIRYTDASWSGRKDYESQDLDDLKQAVVNAVKEDPSIRLLVQTGVLREK